MTDRSVLPWSWLVVALTVLTVPLSFLLLAERAPAVGAVPSLETALPLDVGAWRQLTTQVTAVDPAERGEGLTNGDLYDTVDNRVFGNPAGDRILVTLAYRRVQSPEAKIHRPELCYFAQGFAVSTPAPITVAFAGRRVRAMSFAAKGQARSEAVVYWIRIGDGLTASAFDTRMTLVRDALRGLSPDGLLVRASMLSPGGGTGIDPAMRLAQLQRFLGSLLDRASPAQRRLLIGDVSNLPRRATPAGRAPAA